MTIETKMNVPAGVNADVRAATAEMMAAFEALKAANDARLDEILGENFNTPFDVAVAATVAPFFAKAGLEPQFSPNGVRRLA